MSRPERSPSADRVRVSHAQTRGTLRLALGFIGGAAVAAAVDPGRWLPLHLFLAGGVVLAISGVSLMLTVTWSAAPAPADRWVRIQRGAVAVGAAGVAAGRRLDLGDLVVGGAAFAYLGGLVLQAGLLVVTVRQGVQRRFDAAVTAYVAALAFGVAGVLLGGWMAVGSPSGPARSAHVVANVLGLVGLVVGGTMPYFAATVGRARMAPVATPTRLLLSGAGQASAVAVAVVGLIIGRRTLAAGALVAYALGVLFVLGALPRPTRRQVSWAGPRLLALWAGGLWWAVAVAATAVDVAAGRGVFGGRWLLVLVVAGYAQILWGSLAYVVPMLRGGGPEALTAGFAATRSWAGFVAANAFGGAVAADLPGTAAGLALVVWVVDGGWRVARVGLQRLERSVPDRVES